VIDQIIQAERERERAQTAALLKEIPGGDAVLTFLNGWAGFHDAEIVSLTLDYASGSKLVLAVTDGDRWATFAFSLKPWIDIDLKDFGHQNVINRLVISRPHLRQGEDSDTSSPSDLELFFGQCYGAYGSIKAGIEKIEFIRDGR